MHILWLLAVVAGQAGEPEAPGVPVAWHGTWTGTLKVHFASGLVQSMPMELRLAPLDQGRVSWRFTYGAGGKRQVRDYELRRGESTNRFIMDEKNGLLIDHYRQGDTLLSHFKVNEKLVTVRHRWSGDRLFVEMTTASMQAPRTSKLDSGKADVESYQLESTQTAELTKLTAPIRRSPRAVR